MKKSNPKKQLEKKQSEKTEKKKSELNYTPKTKFQKITNERKEKIENVVRELVGEEAIPIVLYLIGKTKVSEFTIANDLDMEIHKTRNLLYKLFENNILSFIRKKDKIKGWYICYWDFNEKSIPFLDEKIKKNKLQKLNERLAKESNATFYMCKNACTRMDFEKAMEFNFKCPECGELMNEQDNTKTIDSIKQRLKELSK